MLHGARQYGSGNNRKDDTLRDCDRSSYSFWLFALAEPKAFPAGLRFMDSSARAMRLKMCATGHVKSAATSSLRFENGSGAASATRVFLQLRKFRTREWVSPIPDLP